jgi:lipoprotein-anchoring transpeptidase ErfK/SrfK
MLALLGAAAGGAVFTGVILGRDPGPGPARDDAFARAERLPPPPEPAFRPRRPRLLDDRAASSWAPVRARATVRKAPAPAGEPIAALSTRTPEETTNVVAVLDRRQAGGRTWVKVQIPALPRNATGWVPRSKLGGYQFVHTHLVVDVDRLTATLFDRGRVVFRTVVGVGTDAAPTPTGEFYVRSKLTRFRSPFYGPVAFGTSARSPTLTDWPDGGFIGIHGTNQPELLPGRVSHGCIRMRNSAILRLNRLLPIGTPLTIRGG